LYLLLFFLTGANGPNGRSSVFFYFFQGGTEQQIDEWMDVFAAHKVSTGRDREQDGRRIFLLLFSNFLMLAVSLFEL